MRQLGEYGFWEGEYEVAFQGWAYLSPAMPAARFVTTPAISYSENMHATSSAVNPGKWSSPQ